MKGDNYPGIPMRGEWRKVSETGIRDVWVYFETGLYGDRERGFALIDILYEGSN